MINIIRLNAVYQLMIYSIYWLTVADSHFCLKYQENKYFGGSQAVLRKPL